MKRLQHGLAIAFLLSVYSCTTTTIEPNFEKPVLLQGNANPVVHGGWRKMGDFFNENATVTFMFALRDKAYYRVDIINQKLESNFWEYDPAANRFSKKAMIPADYAQNGSLAIAINNIGYYGLGSPVSFGGPVGGNTMWAYDPATDTWTRKANGPANHVSFPGTFVIGDNAYLLGYGDSTGHRQSKELYKYSQQTDAWQSLGTDYPLASYGLTRLQFGVNGKAYIMGRGYSGLDLKTVVFDAATENFLTSFKAPFPYEYEPQTHYILQGKIYLYCGGKDYNSYVNTNEIWRYDPAADKWEQQPDFGGPIRHRSAAFVIGDKAYIGFGYNAGKQYPDIWEYNP